jgi:hypothetical protein
MTVATIATSKSAVSSVQSVTEHLSEPITERSLPEPRSSDTKMSVTIMTKSKDCFLGYQFEFSFLVKISRGVKTDLLSSD